MVILDIDADFFFWPTAYDEDNKKEILAKQTQTKNIKEVLNRFIFKDPKRYKIFNDHDSLYYDIRLNNYLVTELIHIDAHSDLSNNDGKFQEGVGIGNFITPLLNEQIIRSMTWLYQDEDNVGEDLFLSNVINLRFSDYNFLQQIDIAYFTISKEYCPPNNLDIQFKEYMDNLERPKKFQWSLK